SIWSFAEDDTNGFLFLFSVDITQESQRGLLAHWSACNSLNKVRCVVNGSAFKLNNDIAGLKTRFGCRRRLSTFGRSYGRYDSSFCFRQSVNFCKLLMHRFKRDAEIAAFYFSLANNLFIDKVGLVGGKRKADAVVIPG